MLAGPAGQTLLLMSDAGGSNGTTVMNNVTLTVDDAAAMSLPDSSQIFTGTVRPTNYNPNGVVDTFPAPAPSSATMLTTFNNTAPNGPWQLYVVDDAGGKACPERSRTEQRQHRQRLDPEPPRRRRPRHHRPAARFHHYTASPAPDFNTARTIVFSDLQVTDPDNTYPTGFTLTVSDGANYTRSGNQITPAPGFYGTLSVPVKVRDGLLDSNTFNLAVTVNPDPADVKSKPQIASEPGGGYRVTFIANPGQPYTIQSATELSPADWQTLRVETATANALISIVDNPPPGTPKRFYRLLIP